MYIVTKPFYDLQDVTKADHTKDGDIPLEYWLYKVGDIYPRNGAPEPSEQRIAELASAYNKQGTPLITWVEPEPEPAEAPAEPAQPAETDEKPAKAEEPAEPKKPVKKPPVKAPAKKRTPRTSAKPARKKGT